MLSPWRQKRVASPLQHYDDEEDKRCLLASDADNRSLCRTWAQRWLRRIWLLVVLCLQGSLLCVSFYRIVGYHESGIDGAALTLVDSNAWQRWAGGAFRHEVDTKDDDGNGVCPQVAPWVPLSHEHALPAIPSRKELAGMLAGGVRVDTSVYDDFPLPVDSEPEAWSRVFRPFQDYLARTFPEVHDEHGQIDREIINHHGLLYTWRGKKASLKPIIFMAHQDVVPVEPTTVNDWAHAPFSGYVDYEKDVVFGRGASDDKASLITLLASLTSLLKSDFEPERTIILSFGFDEEASGTQGARKLAQHLEERYGRHDQGRGAYMVIDEGSGLEYESYGEAVAGPSVAEKGYVDVRVAVLTPGGHSSQPPKHTSIGLLSRVIAAIEDHPFDASLSIREDQNGSRRDNPGLETLLCTYSTPKMRGTTLGTAVKIFVQARLRVASLQPHKDDSALQKAIKRRLLPAAKRALFAARDNVLAAIKKEPLLINEFRTTQAVDLISGGVKINALPERAQAVVNLRINVEESVKEVHEHLVKYVSPIAQQYGLNLKAFGQDVARCKPSGNGSNDAPSPSPLGTLLLEDAFASPLPSAPPTPTRGEHAAPYRLFSSVVRHTWSRGAFGNSDEAVRVAPQVMIGNTDTQSYWNLTRHIMRFAPDSLAPLRDESLRRDHGIHTVNEFVPIDSLRAAFRFYTSMMIAAQSAKDE